MKLDYNSDRVLGQGFLLLWLVDGRDRGKRIFCHIFPFDQAQ
ncbi:hypothetical protein K661_02626 [Piscirickettsia salmonis LF-89 = ATCC VR-1361]|nr:hypothetical protein K661_02626 [Piscirickettsia salmonis LF-89 = ATCC VR-1361]